MKNKNKICRKMNQRQFKSLFFLSSLELECLILIVIQLFIIFIDCLKRKAMDPNPYHPTLYYSSQIKKLKQNPKKYHELLKQFLTHFKVYKCQDQSNHSPQICFYYHDLTDRRRNPYLNHQFLYNIFQLCSCSQPQCPYIHNNYQRIYHPLAYKLNLCPKQSSCDLGFYCYLFHPEDTAQFEYGEFFRFDLRTFKTQKCYKKNMHQRKTCIYYHNDKDKRRPSNIVYSHFYCEKQKCNNQNCQFSHNKLQQLYHPNRYKTKFCQFYPNNIENCDYKSFCSFAHTQDQIIQNIELIHLLEKNNDFYINKYKTVWCPFTQNHQRDKCPYAHNIQDFRRNPKEYHYDPIRCEFWNFSDEIKSIEGAGCKFGMNCDKCHGWMQQRYHPSKYTSRRSISRKKQGIQAVQSIVNKKIPDLNLTTQIKAKGKGNTNPQIIVKNNYNKGTPFFKNDKYSEQSVKTKAKTNNFESDKSIDGSSNKQALKTVGGCKIIPPSVGNMFAFIQGQDQINWQSEDQGLKFNEQIQQIKEENSARSKSAQKSQEYSATYSNSIRDVLEDADILKKLQKQKFNEIQIMNMDQNKIDKLSFLTTQQKNRLGMKLKIYNLKQVDSVTYSKQLTKYFISKKKQGILQKMQNKRVKQGKLLKLVGKEISQLSFLQQQEKNILPKLLKEYLNEKEFKELDQRIKEETKMK